MGRDALVDSGRKNAFCCYLRVCYVHLLHVSSVCRAEHGLRCCHGSRGGGYVCNVCFVILLTR